MNKPATRFKSVSDLICKTTSKTFQLYWKEMRRHEATLRKIYADDKKHICVAEEVGSIHQVHPHERHILTFKRCAVCMKDMP